MEDTQENPTITGGKRIDVFNRCEKLTGFRFEMVGKEQYEKQIQPLVDEDRLICEKGGIKFETQGTPDWPLHDINWPAESEWISADNKMTRISPHVASCYAGIQIDSQGRLRLFHHDFTNEWEEGEIRQHLDNPQVGKTQGFYLSGLSNLDTGAGKIYRELGLSPLYKDNDKPEYTNVGIIVDPNIKKVLIAIIEDLGLRDYN
ncbi:hypothetical protein HY612_04960 [Candidatus Roizmanbacteria bacterium]|nr:hypothetical protein [Candidatus Roizmanbacteria bacterium]